jgi:hypothetical protein
MMMIIIRVPPARGHAASHGLYWHPGPAGLLQASLTVRRTGLAQPVHWGRSAWPGPVTVTVARPLRVGPGPCQPRPPSRWHGHSHVTVTDRDGWSLPRVCDGGCRRAMSAGPEL